MTFGLYLRESTQKYKVEILEAIMEVMQPDTTLKYTQLPVIYYIITGMFNSKCVPCEKPDRKEKKKTSGMPSLGDHVIHFQVSSIKETTPFFSYSALAFIERIAFVPSGVTRL